MAGHFWIADSGLVTCPAANTPLSLMQLVAQTNIKIMVHHFIWAFDGVTATDTPVKCEVLNQTGAGTSSALTLNHYNDSDGETIQSTALQTFTGEPTPGTVKEAREVHMQGDPWEWGYPKNPNPIPVKGGNRLGFRITTGGTITGTVHSRVIALCEE